MKDLYKWAYYLVLVGGLNWGLVGLFDFNLVTWLLGSWPGLVRLVYVLMGAGAVWAVAKKK